MNSPGPYPLTLRLAPAGRVAPGIPPRLKLKGWSGSIRVLPAPPIQARPLKLKGRAQNSPTSETLRHVTRRSRGPNVRTHHVGPLRNVTLHGFRRGFDQTLCAHPVGCRDVTDFGTALRP